MKEKIITTNKNGMAMLIFIIIAYLVAIPLIPIGDLPGHDRHLHSLIRFDGEESTPEQQPVVRNRGSCRRHSVRTSDGHLGPVEVRSISEIVFHVFILQSSADCCLLREPGSSARTGQPCHICQRIP